MIYVKTAIVISRPRMEVAEFAADPQNATAWYVNIKSVDLLTTPPLRKGSRVSFMAKFMGEELAYTYTVSEFVPGKVMVMEAADGPFPMQTTYMWDSVTDQDTRMTLINQGYPKGFSKWMTPFMSFMMRYSNHKDLKRLKRLLEGSKNPTTRQTTSSRF